MSLNYTKEQIQEISDNAKLYRETKVSKVEQKRKERQEHEIKVFDFNCRLESLFRPEFKISGPLTYKLDRGYNLKFNKKPFDPTINYWHENNVKLEKSKLKERITFGNMSSQSEKRFYDYEMAEFKSELDNTLPKIKKLKSFKIDEMTKYHNMINNSPSFSNNNRSLISGFESSDELSIISYNNPERELIPPMDTNLVKTTSSMKSDLSTITI